MVDYISYFTNMECAYWHEYQYAYNNINFNNKVVVAIGADCGSIALYAIIHGARHVIAYEKEERLRKLFEQKVCKEFNICSSVEMHGEWKGNEYPPGHVFLMDCEGCEDFLDVSKLKLYKQYCVAIHDWAKKRVELFRALYNSIFTYISDDGRELVLCGGGQ